MFEVKMGNTRIIIKYHFNCGMKWTKWDLALRYSSGANWNICCLKVEGELVGWYLNEHLSSMK